MTSLTRIAAIICCFYGVSRIGRRRFFTRKAIYV